MLEIKYDRYSMIINGRREFIRSGAMHYFRLPSQALWRDRLYKLKAAGYNTVDLYFCWGYHSPAQGIYDFEGIRNVRELLAITRELGLYVIARPGPYINPAGCWPKATYPCEIGEKARSNGRMSTCTMYANGGNRSFPSLTSRPT